MKIADFVIIIAEMSVIKKIHIKRRLCARFGDLRLKTGGVPPLLKNRKKSSKIADFRKTVGRNRNLTPEMDSLGSITYI